MSPKKTSTKNPSQSTPPDTSQNTSPEIPMPPMGGGGMPPMGGGGMPPMGGDMGMGQPPMGGGMGQPPMQGKPQKLNPLQQKYMATVRDLTEQASNLVIKVATCKCDKREDCKLFCQSRKIAEKVEYLQELGQVGVPSGKNRRKTRT